MTIGEVIAAAKAEKPNSCEENTLFAWVARLENMICAEILKEPPRALQYPEDMNAVLCAPQAYERIYLEYVFAMIDFQNQEFSAYQNEMELFNESFDSYSKWYLRNHIPKTNEKVKT